MLAEIGNLFIALSLGFTCVQIGASTYNRSPQWQTLGRVSALLQSACLTLAFLTLIMAFYLCDFSLSLVFLHDHTALPWPYRIAASWGNHAGSLLMFLTLLSWGNGVLAAFLPLPLRSPALMIQGAVITLLLLFLILTSNPFHELPLTPHNGQSLNPLLQDKSLLFHPPFLYFGYAGFSAPFSISLAVLWLGERSVTSLSFLKPWVLIPWGCLTAGIAWGSWWAYYELGWGGWWFWDPVETISLMPWLTATGLLHTLITKQAYRWSLLLALLTFGLSLLGTFLVRSGLIISLHSFAEDPRKGYILLSLIGLIMGVALAIWALKAPRPKSSPLPFFSQDNLLLGMTLLLMIILFTLLVGTLYPLIASLMGWGPLVIDAAYFEKTAIPLLLVVFLLMPVGIILTKGRHTALLQTLALPCTLVLSTATLLLYSFAPFSLLTFVGTLTAVWILGGTGMALWRKKLSLSAAFAHIGVGISLLGLSIGGGFREDISQPLGIHETLTVAGFPLTLTAVDQGKESTYLYEKAQMTSPAGTLTPEKRLYQPQNMLISETAIASNGLRDLYVALGPYQGNQRWLIQASFIPLAPWVWLGALLMVIGAGIGLWQRRTTTPQN